MPITLQQLSVAIYVAGGIAQLLQLSIQIYALRRTRHYSVALLCISTTAGLMYLGAAYAMNVLSGQSRWLPRLFWILAVVFAVQTILGVWGTAALFRKWRPHGDSNPGSHRERVVS